MTGGRSDLRPAQPWIRLPGTGRQGACGGPPRQRLRTRADLEARAAASGPREADVITRQHAAATAALRERGRHLLLRGAHIDLALSAQRADLLGVALDLAGFSEDAVAALRRRGYPFASLIRLVGTAGLVPNPTDPFWIEIQSDNPESLARRMKAVRAQVEEAMRGLVGGG